jgi:hypothetical protein
MKKHIFAWLSLVVALMFTMPGMAVAGSESSTVSLEGLSSEQVQKIKGDVDAARKNSSPELSAMDKAVSVGRMLGAGIVATAREVGVAVNDFAKSDVGRIVTAVLVWKYIGHDILGVVFGSIVLFAGVPLGLCIARSAYIKQVNKEYAVAKYLWGAFSLRVTVKNEVIKRDVLGDAASIRATVGYAVTLISFIVGMACIF